MLCGGGDPESRQEAEGAEKRGKESKKDRPRGGTDHRARQDGGTHAHTHTHAHAHMHTRDAHAHSALAHTRSTHAHAHAAHARMYTHTHMCTHTHACRHAHTCQGAPARLEVRSRRPRAPLRSLAGRLVAGPSARAAPFVPSCWAAEWTKALLPAGCCGWRRLPGALPPRARMRDCYTTDLRIIRGRAVQGRQRPASWDP